MGREEESENYCTGREIKASEEGRGLQHTEREQLQRVDGRRGEKVRGGEKKRGNQKEKTESETGSAKRRGRGRYSDEQRGQRGNIPSREGARGRSAHAAVNLSAPPRVSVCPANSICCPFTGLPLSLHS